MPDFNEFCQRLAGLSELGNTQKALAILWWHDQEDSSCELSASALRSLLREHGLGSPSTTYLKRKLTQSKLTLKGATGFRLNARARTEIHELVQDALDLQPTSVDSGAEYLPKPVWEATRGYLEKISVQLNGCYFHGYYDAAAVMVRRIFETLMIEAYEHMSRQKEIQGPDGNYFMLGALTNQAVGENGLNLGREARDTLRNVKVLGDRSAHNRRFVAKKVDMDRLRSGVRVTFEELVTIAEMR